MIIELSFITMMYSINLLTVTLLYSVKQISLEDKYSFIFSISELIFSFDAIFSFAISSCSLITTICSLIFKLIVLYQTVGIVSIEFMEFHACGV